MPTTNIDQRVLRLVDLTGEDLNALTDIGVTTEESLSFIQFEDLPVDISLIKRRKLDIIRQYLAKGNSLTATIEMTEVNRIVTRKKGLRVCTHSDFIP